MFFDCFNVFPFFIFHFLILFIFSLPGSHKMTPEKPKRAHWAGQSQEPRPQPHETTTKFERGKKSAICWASHPSGSPPSTSVPPLSLGFGNHPSGPRPLFLGSGPTTLWAPSFFHFLIFYFLYILFFFKKKFVFCVFFILSGFFGRRGVTTRLSKPQTGLRFWERGEEAVPCAPQTDHRFPRHGPWLSFV